MLLHQPPHPTRGSRRRRRPNPPARRRARRPFREDLEPRTLLTIAVYPGYGAENTVDYGGLKLDSPNVYLLFWGGSFWNSTSGQQMENAVVADTRQLLSSGYFLGLKQYGVDGTPHFGGVANDNSGPSGNFSQASLQSVIQNAIGSGEFPAPVTLADNPIYAVLTPPDVSSDEANAGGYNTHGTWFGGFPTTLIYDWVGSSSFTGSPISYVDQYTQGLSHELVETITDPLQGSGIEVTPGANFPNPPPISNQIADYEAAYYTYRLGGPGGVLVQSYWSERDQAFIIPEGSPQTLWDEGGSLWVLPEQNRSYANNFVTISMNDYGLQVGVDTSRFWFAPSTIGINDIVAALTGTNDVISVGQTPLLCPVTIDLEAAGCGVSIGSNWGSGLSGIQSNLTVEFFSSGANVNVNDGADTNTVTWNIQGGSIGWGAGTIDLMGQSGDGNAVTINGGSGWNNYVVNDGPGAFTTTLNTGNGNDVVDVVDSGGGLTVNTGSGRNDVVIGDPSRPVASGLDGNVAVSGGGGGTTYLIVDDRFDHNARDWNIQGRSVSFGGAGTISLGGYGIALTIDGGWGQSYYDVDDGPGAFPTTLFTGNGNDYVSVFDSAGGLTVNTGSGTNDVVIGGPTGADAAYLDGNVVVSGGSGGTTDVWIVDYQNNAPTTWYYTNRLYYSGGMIHVITTYSNSRSPYTITLENNISSIDFWGSSTDTLVYWSPVGFGGLAVLGLPGGGPGTTGGMSPLPPAGQAGAGPDPLIAGATGSDSGILYDLALESILAEWPSSDVPILGISPFASDGRPRTV